VGVTGFWGGVAALLPPVGVGLIFWVVMRAIVQADRRERAAMARLEAAEDAAQAHGDAAEHVGAGGDAQAPVDDAGDPSS
jgi:hypothetical protein